MYLVDRRCYHHSAIRIFALASTADLAEISYHIMNNLAIQATHGFQRDGFTRFRHLLGDASCEFGQGCGPTSANPSHIHTDLAFSDRSAGPLKDCTNQLVNCLGGRSSPSDKESHTFSPNFDPHDAVREIIPRQS